MRLNTVMMRWLRRILREPRAPIPGRVRLSDEEVRVRAGVGSVESLLQQRRLGYVASLLRSPLPPLLALLQGTDDAPDSWSQLVLRDLRAVQAAMPQRTRLPDPADAPQARRNLANAGRSAWKAAARRVVTTASALRAPEIVSVNLAEVAAEERPAFVCEQCPPERARSFACMKALKSHWMREHGHRKLGRSFIHPDCSTCPACGKQFASHAKALDHLEYRAKRCREAMLRGDLQPC